jgi:hypothetical protein
MSTPSPQTPPTPEVPTGRNRSGLVALILGIVAIVLAVVPFASYGAWLIGLAAVVVGILAIIRPGLPKRAGVVGIVLGGVSVVLSAVMSVIYTLLFAVAVATAGASSGGYSSQSAGAPVGGSGAPHEVVYSVTGSGRALAIAYYTVSGGQSGQTTLRDQALPWSKSVTVRGGLTTGSSVLTVIGQNAGSGRIACSITLDGKVVVTQSGEGKGSTAQCIYRPTS